MLSNVHKVRNLDVLVDKVLHFALATRWEYEKRILGV